MCRANVALVSELPDLADPPPSAAPPCRSLMLMLLLLLLLLSLLQLLTRVLSDSLLGRCCTCWGSTSKALCPVAPLLLHSSSGEASCPSEPLVCIATSAVMISTPTAASDVEDWPEPSSAKAGDGCADEVGNMILECVTGADGPHSARERWLSSRVLNWQPGLRAWLSK